MTGYQWTSQDDATVRAEHRDLDYGAFPAAPTRHPACRCFVAPVSPMTRYPKRWSRAKRKAARAAAIRRLARWAP